MKMYFSASPTQIYELMHVKAIPVLLVIAL